MPISGYSCALWIALVYVCVLIKRPFPLFLSLMKFLRYSGAGAGQTALSHRQPAQAGMLATWRTHSLSFNTPWELSLKVSG